MKLDYINGDIKNGILYDFDKIRKEYKKLKCPDIFYNPSLLPLDLAKYFVGVSERSTGKTTGWVLLGMVMNKLYGTEIQYIRQSEDMIAPKNLNKFMDVIIQNGYIEKLTDGKYNSCEYKARKWRYIKIEDGEIVERCNAIFMYCLDLDEAATYKSSYNAPYGDLILFDEFISKRYYPNEFVTFCDIVKTIIRERLSPFIVMLANTTDRYNTYFQELMIQQEILRIKVNEHFVKQTTKGTTIYCELIGNKNIEREKLNELFFGFKNPRLASITGGDWAIDNYQHIVSEPCDTLIKAAFIEFNNYLVQLEVCHNERLGIFIKAHKANKPYDDCVIYTAGEILDRRYRYRLGTGKPIDNLIFKRYTENKFYYSNNEVGNVVQSYIEHCKKLA